VSSQRHCLPFVVSGLPIVKSQVYLGVLRRTAFFPMELTKCRV